MILADAKRTQLITEINKNFIKKSALLMVLGFEPVDKPIIPRRSFFLPSAWLHF